MKHSYCLTVVFFMSIFFVACDTEKSNVNNQEENVSSNETKEDSEKELKSHDLKGMREYNMNPHELDINIFIPEKFYNDEDDLPRHVKPDVKHNEGEARWEITVPGDRRWHMVIEEIGKDSSSISDEMEKHSSIAFFTYNYEEVTEQQMIFSRFLKSENTTLDSNEMSSLPNYHFYCSRDIKNYHLVFKNHEQKDFRKITVKKMLASAMNAY